MTLVTDRRTGTQPLTPQLDRAFPETGAPDPRLRESLLAGLHSHYVAYMSGPEDFARTPRLNTDPHIRQIEDAWLRWEDAQVDQSQLPRTGAAFRDWFLAVADDHTQPEFCAYLAEEATLPEMALFFMGEELVDSKFDDLMAMVQIGTQGHTKLTIAENYWDEMGEGDINGVHTRMFEHSAVYMRARLADAGIDRSALHCPEAFENACLLLMYGIHRHLNPRALGAMGVLEQSASPRFQAMVDGCDRLGVPPDVIDYQRVHVHVDADHGAEWFDGVFVPLVDRSPELLREISLGVATRVRVADAYYRRIWNVMRDLSH
ncbi:iron-containing redox enzyme family protein [Streptomyces sp. TRM 70351]|uniref:iron-containing redox enzyme family protein n=1 Tax=Streptomyces sp. TRM 70351 TaxID=3116552 RepID=UPI002E7B8EA2|nr:iron-containing redox enzyme family protein [Streptomyces sp. TRM 70351]MEE1930437.1 iron-containing redox enzyme family protein [Streptomyces sp. TRM 70351]